MHVVILAPIVLALLEASKPYNNILGFPYLGNGWNTVSRLESRVLFRNRELTEFCGKLGKFCEKLGEFTLAHTHNGLRGTH